MRCRSSRFRSATAAAILAAALVSSAQPPGEEPWIERPAESIDARALTPRGRQVLGLEGIDWKHVQTRHFVIHYEQAIFARKVARMAEFFYAFIAEDLRGAQDRLKGRSHIFIFRSEKRWQEFARTIPGIPEWTFSQAEGPVLYLQQADSTSSSGDVLAHEMTHLVINRFFEAAPPLWLNEGLAEYYEEFGYAAYKGVKKSRRAQFSKLNEPYPLEGLVRATTYPRIDWQVDQFYRTSKYVVAYLLLEQPPERFLPFLTDLVAGDSVTNALRTHYEMGSLADFEKAFGRFAN